MRRRTNRLWPVRREMTASSKVLLTKDIPDAAALKDMPEAVSIVWSSTRSVANRRSVMRSVQA